jgi:ribosomal protein L32
VEVRPPECDACGNYIISHPASLNYRGLEEHMPIVEAYTDIYRDRQYANFNSGSKNG